MGKAIDTVATAIGNAVRVYRAGIAGLAAAAEHNTQQTRPAELRRAAAPVTGEERELGDDAKADAKEREPEERFEEARHATGEASSAERIVHGDRESEIDPDAPLNDQDVRLETVQHRDDSEAGFARRPPKDEAERRARNEAFRREASERTKDFKPEDWQKRFDVIVDMAKRDGFLPELVRTHLWSVFRSTRTTDERLDAARTISELLRLFPSEAERHINKGERALVDEVIRLDDEGKVDPDRIIEQAARNVRYPNFLTYFGAAIGGIGGRRRRHDGTIPHLVDREGTGRFLRELQKTLRGTGFQILQQQKEVGHPRRMDVHVVDPRTNHEIILRYEIKTGSGTKSANQKRIDDILGNVKDVAVNLRTGRISINGQSSAVHLRAVRRQLRAL